MPIPLAAVLPSIITGGGSMLSSLFGGISQNKATKDTNANNYKIAQETNAQQMNIARENNAAQLAALRENNAFNAAQALKMFNLENEYNSPTNQKRLLLEAGLNPATMYANGASQATASGSPATSGSSGISPSMPTLTTPRMETPPSVLGTMFSNLSTITNAISNVSRSKLNDSERNKLNVTLDAELQKILSQADSEKANAAWTKLNTRLEQLYGAAGRDSKVRETISSVARNYSEAMLAASKGDTEKAQKLLTDAEISLKKTNARILEAQSPWLVQEAQESVNLIKEKQNTEKSQQTANYGSAAASRAQADLTAEEKRQLSDFYDQNKRIKEMNAQQLEKNVQLLKDTYQEQVEYYMIHNIFTLEQIRKFKNEADILYHDNVTYWHRYMLDRMHASNPIGSAFSFIK